MDYINALMHTVPINTCENNIESDVIPLEEGSDNLLDNYRRNKAVALFEQGSDASHECIPIILENDAFMHMQGDVLCLRDVVSGQYDSRLDRYTDEDFRSFYPMWSRMYDVYSLEKMPDDVTMEWLDELAQYISKYWEKEELSWQLRNTFESATGFILDVAPSCGRVLNQLLYHAYMLCLAYIQLPLEQEDIYIPFETFQVIDKDEFAPTLKTPQRVYHTHFPCTPQITIEGEKANVSCGRVPAPDRVQLSYKDDVPYVVNRTALIDVMVSEFFTPKQMDEAERARSVAFVSKFDKLVGESVTAPVIEIRKIGERRFIARAARSENDEPKYISYRAALPRRVLNRMRAKQFAKSCSSGNKFEAVDFQMLSAVKGAISGKYEHKLVHDMTDNVGEAIDKVGGIVGEIRDAFNSIPDKLMNHAQIDKVVSMVQEKLSIFDGLNDMKDNMMFVGKLLAAAILYGLAIYATTKLQNKAMKGVAIGILTVIPLFLGGCQYVSTALSSVLEQIKRAPDGQEFVPAQSSVGEEFAPVLVSILHYNVLRKKPSEDLVNGVLKSAGDFPRQAKGFSSIIDWILSVFRRFVEWISKKFGYRFNFMQTGSVRADQWIERTREFHKKEHTVQNFLDLGRLIKEGEELSKEFTKAPDIAGPISSVMLCLKDTQKQMMDVLGQEASTRMIPLTICISGAPGVGKSTAVNYLTDEVIIKSLTEMKDVYALKQFAENREKIIYARNTGQDHWDGYKNQLVCVYDDFMQLKEVPGVPREGYELIKASNNWTYNLPMADLHNKSNTFFTSNIIICTTNMKTIKAESIISNEAVERRFDLFVYQVPAREYCTEDTKDSDIHKRRLDESKIPMEDGVPVFTKEVYEFYVADTRSRNGANEPYDIKRVGGDYLKFGWDGMVRTCVQRYVKKYSTFSRNVKAQSNRANELLAEAQAEVGFQMDDDSANESFDMDELVERMATEGQEANPFPDHGSVWVNNQHVLQIIQELEAYFVEKIPQIRESREEFFSEGARRLVSESDMRGVETYYTQYMERIGAMSAFFKMFPDLFPEITKVWDAVNRKYVYHAADFREMIWRMMVLDDILDVYNPDDYNSATWRYAFIYYCNFVRLRFFVERQKDKVQSLTLTIKNKIADARARIYNVMKDYPVLKALLYSAGAVLALLGAIDLFFRGKELFFGNEEEEVETEASSMHRKRANQPRFENDVVEMESSSMHRSRQAIKFESAPTKKGKMPFHSVGTPTENWEKNKEMFVQEIPGDPTEVDFHGGDSRGSSLASKVFTRNQYFLYVDDKKQGVVNAIQNYVVMMPGHFKHTLKQQVRAGITKSDAPTVLRSAYVSEGNQPREIKMKLSTILEAREFDFLERQDVCFFVMPNTTSQHSTIVKYFLKENDISRLNRTPVALDVIQDNRKMITAHMSTVLPTKINVVNEHYTKFLPQALKYTAHTKKGDCGALLRICTNNANCERFIGMHVGGGVSGLAISTAISQEQLRKVVEQMDQHRYRGDSVMVTTSLDEECLIANVPFHGDFIPLTRSAERVSVPSKTKIIPSVLYECCGKSGQIPAKLSEFTDDHGERIDPYTKMLSAYGNTVDEVRQDVLDVCADHLYNTINNRTLDCRRDVLPYEVAVEGDMDRPFLASIPRGTSSGYPYSNRGFKGKKDFFGYGDEFEFGSENEIMLRQEVEEIIEKARRGERSDIVFQDFAKDERRKIEKAMAGKTRMISGSPLAYLIACRMYFLNFSVALMDNRIDVETCIGTNVYSHDWDYLAKRLQNVSDNIIAGDYSSYDKTQSTQMHMSLIDVINRWYSGTEEESRIRFVLYCDLYNARHLAPTGEIYGYTHCLPSGHMLTTVSNSLFNSLAFRFAYVAAHEFDLSSVLTFNTHVALNTYGDDNILAVSDEKLDVYNQITMPKLMSHMGLTYTTEDKGEATVRSRPLTECGFLKRAFVYDRDYNRWIAPLEKEVLYEMPYWTKREETTTAMRITEEVLNTAIKEMSLHSQNDFDKYISDFSGPAASEGIRIYSTSKDALKLHVLNNEALYH